MQLRRRRLVRVEGWLFLLLQTVALVLLGGALPSVAFRVPLSLMPRCNMHTSTTTTTTRPVMRCDAVKNGAITELMQEHDPILLFASNLLPSDTAVDASALYAWCRRLDEICDQPGANPLETQEKLVIWQHRFDQLWAGNPTDEMDAALVHCLQRNSIPRKPFCDMICGMQSDAVDGRLVATMEELEEYAYQVAGTVGLMLLPLLNAKNLKDAEYPAICLGKAIQLINILRDASPDAALGRIYLPQDLLQAQNVQNEDVLALKSSDGYRNVVESVSNRAWKLLEQAEEGRTTLPGLGPLFVQVIVELYRGYLDELERRGYNNLTVKGERVKIGTSRKLMASIIALKKVML